MAEGNAGAAPAGGGRGLVTRLLGPRTFTALRSIYRTVTPEEVRAPFPLRRKLRAWSDGFTATNAALYGFDNAASGLYVSDYVRDKRTVRINPVNAVFDHKLLLHGVLAAGGVARPEVLALVTRHGVLADPLGRAHYAAPDAFAAELVHRGGRYIWKPERGGRGLDVALVEVADGRLVARRGERTQPFRLRGPARGGVLLERAVEQHAFWQALSPYSVNTLRVLTMWTPGDPDPFVGRAVQRVGTRATLPTDNWSGGGINALVNLETGELGPGRVNPVKSGREDRPYTHHPETGAQIQGAVLPNWRAIHDLAIAASRCLPYAPYIGWDVAVGADGAPLIIEGNKNTDVDLLQVHGGLLADARVRRFYEVCGVV